MLIVIEAKSQVFVLGNNTKHCQKTIYMHFHRQYVHANMQTRL